MAMNEHQLLRLGSEETTAVKLASCSRSMKKTEKELLKLATSLRDISKSPIATRFTNRVDEAELAGVTREVVNVTVSAPMAVFLGFAAVSSTSTTLSTTVKNSWTPLRRSSPSNSFKSIEEDAEDCKKSTTEKHEALDECSSAVESRSERSFRCLINTRVSLLNIMNTC